MEPADQTQFRHKLGQQDALLESQQQQLLAVMQCVHTISHQVSTLSTAFQAASLIFNLKPKTFPTDVVRVAYVITQLTGRVKRCGTAAWIADLPCLRMLGEFMAEMQRMFDRSATGSSSNKDVNYKHLNNKKIYLHSNTC